VIVESEHFIAKLKMWRTENKNASPIEDTAASRLAVCIRQYPKQVFFRWPGDSFELVPSVGGFAIAFSSTVTDLKRGPQK
jgi:hypothetical protein